MSWETGGRILANFLEITATEILNDDERKQFNQELLILFSRWDVNPVDMLGISDEMDALVNELFFDD